MLKKRNEKEVTTKVRVIAMATIIMATIIMATVTLGDATTKILEKKIRISSEQENKFATIYRSIAGHVEPPTIRVNSVDLRKTATRMRQLSRNELVVQPNTARLPLEVEERKVRV